MESKEMERCPFCETELRGLKNMQRHVTGYCDKAKAECPGKDILQEYERRMAKRKGWGNVQALFAAKTAKLSAEGKRSDVDRGDGEQLLRDDEIKETNMEVDGATANLEDFRDLDTNANEEPLYHHTEPEVAQPVHLAETDRILEKLSEMNIGINSLTEKMTSVENVIKAGKQMEIPQIARPDDVEPEDDRLCDLRNCKTVNDILELLPEMAIGEAEEEEEEDSDGHQYMYCQLCTSKDTKKGATKDMRVKGRFPIPANAMRCDEKGNLSMHFRNLKKNVKRHIKSDLHTDQWNLWEAAEKKKEKQRTRNQEVGLRVARTALANYQKGRSRTDFEDQILLQVTNGLEMGVLNNSFNFCQKFRKYVYQEVQIMVEKFLSTRTTETGFYPALNIQCDKATSSRRSMQFTSCVCVLANSDVLLANMFLGHPIVKDGTAEGVTQLLCDELEKNKIKPEQVEGLSVDGQYIKWSVPELLRARMQLGPNFRASWDCLHR